MKVDNLQSVKQKIKIERGDFITLSKILNVPYQTAISRYHRNNFEAVMLMRKINTSREKLIKKLKNVETR